MSKTRLSCVACGQLAYWSYERPVDVLQELKKVHEEYRGEHHEVTWEIIE